MGRPVRAEGKVVAEKFGRNDPQGQRRIGKDAPGRKPGDVGFHLIGDSLNGPTNSLNVVPGNGKGLGDLKNLNSGRYAKFEREVRLLAQQPGVKVEIRVEPIYNKGNLTRRPDAFRVSHRVNGDEWITKELIPNAPY